LLVSASYFIVGGLKCFYLFNLAEARETKLKIFNLSGLFLMVPNIYSVRVDRIQHEEGQLCLLKWRKAFSSGRTTAHDKSILGNYNVCNLTYLLYNVGTIVFLLCTQQKLSFFYLSNYFPFRPGEEKYFAQDFLPAISYLFFLLPWRWADSPDRLT